ncbi:hypothetical protein Deia_00216 [Candidatus Deianiraea vastatrix]|uniref:Protein CR006 P-loop domain-containing protein n=1 Tax=Candidatus Deianiraea vastatrix TaxID=2163644 RepID=A0A5B8XF25_9RICK|nr:hypothetical protein Deia_00216 [Candidatus Deianiraea vastatrix]
MDNLIKQEEFRQSIEATNTLLKNPISKSKDIEQVLSKWITEGFTNFYDGNEKDKTICKFCEQEINDNILKKIESIAKSEYQTLIKIINEKISKIYNLKQQYLIKLNRLLSLNESGEIELAAIPNNLNDNKKEGFKKEQEKLKTQLLEFFSELVNYTNNFLAEKGKNPEKDCSYCGDLLAKHENIRVIHQNISNLVKEDNEEKKNARPDEAREKLIKNDVYKFINDDKYLSNIKSIKDNIQSIVNTYNSTIGNKILKYNDNEITDYLDNITIYSNEIKSIAKKEDNRFAEIEKTILAKKNEIIKKFNQEKPDIAQINKNLELIIGNRGFHIDEYLNPDNQLQCYKVKRHSTDNEERNRRLKKFSEGEKTAICFAFYLTRIQESKEKDIIAVIDDPICSLDQNIFHNINESIIENIFKNTQIAQCYILTHSYHLSYLLANYLLSKDNDINKKQDINFFTIQNKLTEKPYKSDYRRHIFTDEYSFLCRYAKELAEMTDNDLKDKDDYYFFSIINVLRRLCENFTKFKIKKDYLDDFEIIDNQIKTYALSIKTYTNYYSHAVKEKNNNFFALSNEEKRNIAKKILAVIKHIDEEHYNAYFS